MGSLEGHIFGGLASTTSGHYPCMRRDIAAGNRPRFKGLIFDPGHHKALREISFPMKNRETMGSKIRPLEGA